METKIIFLCIIVSACAQIVPTRPRRLGLQKPGTCPRSNIITTCQCDPSFNQCDNDRECPGAQKCCDQGCGCRRSCVNPVNRSYLPRRRQNTGNQRVCSQPQIVGNCLAYFPRWWYNARTNQCERFIYGGCGGNQNNFETQTACQRRCQRSYRPLRRTQT